MGIGDMPRKSIQSNAVVGAKFKYHLKSKLKPRRMKKADRVKMNQAYIRIMGKHEILNGEWNA